jgi:hypothetical protein
MKRLFAVLALLLTLAAPLAQAGVEKGGAGVSTLPAGEILD